MSSAFLRLTKTLTLIRTLPHKNPKYSTKVLETFSEEGDEESIKVLRMAVDTVMKKVVRKIIIAEGFRPDGRYLNEVRPLYCKTGVLPMVHGSGLHGSALFNCGDTQVLCKVTRGAPTDTHLPPEDDFPYTFRVHSEVMASDGSTSMATVCGGSMALMHAGIPIREHVAGVSMGLVTEQDPSTGKITDYRILTDISGLEDHLGDIDFKISGTRKGITAIQLDMKLGGIPIDIVCECLEPARKARLHILDHMEQEITVPRIKNDSTSP